MYLIANIISYRGKILELVKLIVLCFVGGRRRCILVLALSLPGFLPAVSQTTQLTTQNIVCPTLSLLAPCPLRGGVGRVP